MSETLFILQAAKDAHADQECILHGLELGECMHPISGVESVTSTEEFISMNNYN